jgi:tetraacyldisaccharide 4'-kinase
MKRADLILVTKSPEDISAETIDEITKELKKFGGREIFFTSLKYDAPLPLFKDSISGQFSLSHEDRGNRGVVLVTGIAFSGPFKEYLGKYFSELEHLDFPDHHCYTGPDIEKITRAVNHLKSSEKYIVTTEKDAIRISEFTNIALPLKTTFSYIPISVKFLNYAGPRFENLIIEYVRKNNRNSRVPQN